MAIVIFGNVFGSLDSLAAFAALFALAKIFLARSALAPSPI